MKEGRQRVLVRMRLDERCREERNGCVLVGFLKEQHSTRSGEQTSPGIIYLRWPLGAEEFGAERHFNQPTGRVSGNFYRGCACAFAFDGAGGVQQERCTWWRAVGYHGAVRGRGVEGTEGKT